MAFLASHLRRTHLHPPPPPTGDDERKKRDAVVAELREEIAALEGRVVAGRIKEEALKAAADGMDGVLAGMRAALAVPVPHAPPVESKS